MSDVPLFPLIRHLSRPLSRVLVALPLTPNQITLAAAACGLAGAWAFAQGTWRADLAGAAALLACYLLDNCDGEVARAKQLCTRAGALLDSAVDALVHAALFAGLGAGAWQASGEVLWLWLGAAATAGTVINSAIALPREARALWAPGAPPAPAPAEVRPHTWREHFIYAFRELSRADFCFIVLALALADAVWLLLPAAAVGAQVYWLTGLYREASRFHV